MVITLIVYRKVKVQISDYKMLSSKMKKKKTNSHSGYLLFCWLVAMLVAWSAVLLGGLRFSFCCLNAALIMSILQLHDPNNVSMLSAGMSPIAFSVLLSTEHSAELPAAVPSAIVPVTSF